MTVVAWVRARLRTAENALDRSGKRRARRERFPVAVGATDRELVRLGRRDEPLEILRRARMATETGGRGGPIAIA